MARDSVEWPDGLCVACGLPPTPEGHDPCIARLPGVLFACCGHGLLHDCRKGRRRYRLDGCYVFFDDGITLYGNVARAAMHMLGGRPPDRPPTRLPLWDHLRGNVFVPPSWPAR